jgi:hypothetical protein
LKYTGSKIALSNVSTFHDIASKKIEWLYTPIKNGKVMYRALIHKLNVDGVNNSGVQTNTEVTYVTKLDGKNTCTVAELRNVPDASAKAHKIAEDVAAMKCLSL